MRLLAPACQPPRSVNDAPFTPPEIAEVFDWRELLGGRLHQAFLETILPAYVPGRRWFGGKARARRGFAVAAEIPFAGTARVLFVRVEYLEGAPEIYLLPLQTATGEAAQRIARESPSAAVAWFRAGAEATLLFDALHDETFRAALLRMIGEGQSVGGPAGLWRGIAGRGLGASWGPLASRVLEVEQSNSSVIYEGRFFLKLYRRIEEGVNPDAEITRFLSERQRFTHGPVFAGEIECHREGLPRCVVALLVGLVPNQGDAWVATLAALRDYCARIPADRPVTVGAVADFIGEGTMERVRLLGQRTGEMHLALAAESVEPAFVPEPFTAQDLQTLHGAMCAAARTGLAALRRHLPALPAAVRTEAAELADREGEILARHARLLAREIGVVKTRIHGDYHLGQVLVTGDDFVILDFEGEPARPLAERQCKASPLRDVAGMLRSFAYAARTVLYKAEPLDRGFLVPWVAAWERTIGRQFLDAYLSTTVGAPFVPARSDDLTLLLESFLFDKAIYEVGYELNNRPDWLPIPVSAILELLRH